MKQALVIIDMQEVFFNTPQYHLYTYTTIVNNINTLITHARTKNIPVIFVQHTDTNPDNLLAEGKDDWHLHKNLHITPEDTIIQKTKWDAFYKTELLTHLEKHNIEQLIFAGAQTEFCFDTTLRAAYSLGYQHNIVFRHTQSTINSSILDAATIIAHHESIWHNRFTTLHDLSELESLLI